VAAPLHHAALIQNKNLLSSRNCLNRWAISSTVWLRSKRSIASSRRRSLGESRAMVASSRISSSVSPRIVRQAQAQPLAATDPVARSPTRVSYPFGRVSMKPAASAA
jgi:hypothetical protein